MGWDVWYQPQYDIISIQKEAEAPGTKRFSLERRDPVLGHPSILLRVEPLISPETYARFTTENEAIYAQLSQLATQMIKAEMKNHFGDYIPANEEEKKLVDARKKLLSSLHGLPDFYFRDISLSWVEQTPWGVFQPKYRKAVIPTLKDKDEAADDTTAWKRERARASDVVLRLLSRYKPVEPVGNLEEDPWAIETQEAPELKNG